MTLNASALQAARIGGDNMLCSMTRTLLLALLVGAPALLAGCAHSGDAAGLDPLPVKRVVLYQNGVGYFERAGTLHGDTLRLAVRPEQINDLLTSLTVL